MTIATDPVIANVFLEFWAGATQVVSPPESAPPYDGADLLHYYESFTDVTLDGSGDAIQMNDQVTGLHFVSGGTADVEVDGELGVQVLVFPAANNKYLELPSGSHNGRTAGHIFMLLKCEDQIAAPSSSGLWTYGPTHERYKSDVAGAADLSYGRPNTVFPQYDDVTITHWHLMEIEAGTDYWANRVTKAGITTTIMELTSANTPDWNNGAIRLGVSSGLNINGNYRMALLAEFEARQSADNAGAFRRYVRDLLPGASL